MYIMFILYEYIYEKSNEALREAQNPNGNIEMSHSTFNSL